MSGFQSIIRLLTHFCYRLGVESVVTLYRNKECAGNSICGVTLYGNKECTGLVYMWLPYIRKECTGIGVFVVTLYLNKECAGIDLCVDT